MGFLSSLTSTLESAEEFKETSKDLIEQIRGEEEDLHRKEKTVEQRWEEIKEGAGGPSEYAEFIQELEELNREMADIEDRIMSEEEELRSQEKKIKKEIAQVTNFNFKQKIERLDEEIKKLEKKDVRNVDQEDRDRLKEAAGFLDELEGLTEDLVVDKSDQKAARFVLNQLEESILPEMYKEIEFLEKIEVQAGEWESHKGKDFETAVDRIIDRQYKRSNGGRRHRTQIDKIKKETKEIVERKKKIDEKLKEEERIEEQEQERFVNELMEMYEIGEEFKSRICDNTTKNVYTKFKKQFSSTFAFPNGHEVELTDHHPRFDPPPSTPQQKTLADIIGILSGIWRSLDQQTAMFKKIVLALREAEAQAHPDSDMAIIREEKTFEDNPFT